MPTGDIFRFDDHDLVNLQRWYKKKPRQFTGAVRNMLNTVAARTKIEAVEIIKSRTTTRAASFVKNSLRVQRAKGSSLNKLESQTFSFDISKKGRSSGFEELEDGGKSKSHRVPTMQARGGGQGKSSSKVTRGVRMDRQGAMLKHKQFKSRKFKSKSQQVTAMINHARKNKVKTPMVIPSGLRGTLGRMTPGIWKMKTAKNFALMNPFKGDRGATKAIHWMRKAVDTTTSNQALKVLWGKEVDKILRKN